MSEYNAFLNNFDCQRDVESSYGLTEGDLDGCRFIIADYTYENYSGSSFVLFVAEDGRLYENHGSHCSCYGLEGQWSPEETSVEELEGRLDRGGLGEYEYVLRQALEKLKRGKGMRKVVFYEASDGTRFEDENECQEYEETMEMVNDLSGLLNESQAKAVAKYFFQNYRFKRKS